LGGCFQERPGQSVNNSINPLYKNEVGRLQGKPMATIILGNSFVFLIVCCFATIKGLDLKQRSSWWYGLYGFISGFLIGFLVPDDSGSSHLVINWAASIQAGIAFPCIVLIGGASTRWNRMRAEKYLELTERHVEEQYDSLAEKLFNDRKSRKRK